MDIASTDGLLENFSFVFGWSQVKTLFVQKQKKKRKEKKNGQQWIAANNLMQRATVPRDFSQSRPWNANNKPLGVTRVRVF